MTGPLAAGGLAGLGVWLVWRALTTRPSLDRVAATLAGQGHPAHRPRPAAAERGSASARQAMAALARLSFLDPAQRAADLNVTRRSVDDHVLTQVVSAATALFIAVAAGFVLGPIAAVAVALVLVPLGFSLPELTLGGDAAKARAAWLRAFGGYLDIVNLIEAAGAGPETALADAAQGGEGPAFDDIRDALGAAERAKAPAWRGLAELAERVQVKELAEFASALALVGSEGARIRDTLAAKADALRDRQLADAEAAAQRSTERMSLPVVLILAGFLLLVAFPAAARITQVGAP